MRVYLATANLGKAKEIAAVFAGSALEVVPFDGYRPVAEDAPDYLGNALLKARALAARLRSDGFAAASLADDSGLEVDALGGKPGVYSARFGGEGIGWPRRRQLLLEALEGVPPQRRGAAFVCTLVMVEANGDPLTAVGRVAGTIAQREQGDGGFGYDPLFFYPPRGATFAELSEAEKNGVSHRRAAADALLEALRRRG